MENTTDLKNDDINRAIWQAEYANGKVPHISIDAFFIAFYLKPPKGFIFSKEPEQPDFSGFDVSQFFGRKMTASKVAEELGLEVSPGMARKVGIYLRSQGFTPRKTNGVLVFDL